MFSENQVDLSLRRENSTKTQAMSVVKFRPCCLVLRLGPLELTQIPSASKESYKKSFFPPNN